MPTEMPSFERAEYRAGPVTLQTCASCGKTLVEERYFRLNGRETCEACANVAVTAPAVGASAAFGKAVMVGLVAAVVGCVLYAVVEIATGWTIGYAAVGVGWMVGKGMKWASEGRGGRRYQVAAAALTYLSVSFASVLVVVHAVQKQHPGGHIDFGPQFVAFAAKYGLASPFLELQQGLGGLLGLFILFIGIRTAWGMTAGSEYAITGPYNAQAEA